MLRAQWLRHALLSERQTEAEAEAEARRYSDRDKQGRRAAERQRGRDTDSHSLGTDSRSPALGGCAAAGGDGGSGRALFADGGVDGWGRACAGRSHCLMAIALSKPSGNPCGKSATNLSISSSSSGVEGMSSAGGSGDGTALEGTIAAARTEAAGHVGGARPIHLTGAARTRATARSQELLAHRATIPASASEASREALLNFVVLGRQHAWFRSSVCPGLVKLRHFCAGRF